MAKSLTITVLFLSLGVGVLSYYNDVDEEIKVLALKGVEKEIVVAKGCILVDLSLICDETPDDENIVPSGTLCFPYGDSFIGSRELICDQGTWNENTSEKVKEHILKKRDHQSCTSTRTRSRRWFRRRRRVRTRCTKINHVPSFTPCPSKTVTTPIYTTSTIVTWGTPTAYDYEDGRLSVQQTSGVSSGDIFEGSAAGKRYTAYYTTADSAGSKITCALSITVKVIYCSTPTTPDHGSVTCPSGKNYGQQCTFSCTNGFTPTVSTIRCLSNGQWSDDGISKCIGVSCPQTLPNIPNGYYECNNFTYGSTCDPICDPDYSAPVKYPITCGVDGQWTLSSSSACKDSDPPIITGCPDNIIAAAGSRQTSANITWIIPTAFDYQDNAPSEVRQVVGNKSPGSNFEGGISHTIKYQAFDVAGNPSEECTFTVEVTVKQCSSFDAPDKGHYECDLGLIYGSQCTFSCFKGYELQGTEHMTCGQYGIWDSSVPDCSEITCDVPEMYGHSIQNGYYDCPSPILYQSACNVACNSGFKLDQYTTAMCDVDSENNPTFTVTGQPECIDNEPPVFPYCGQNNVLTFDAIKGTRSAQINYTTPFATDNYDSFPSVTKVAGPNKGDTISADRIKTVEFQAMDDAGNPSDLCIFTLEVEVIECPVYIPVVNAELTCNDNVYGSVCTVTCDDGYEVSGSSESECLQDGSWSVSDLVCIKTLCPTAPSPPTNGLFECADLTYAYNSICYAKCDTGFTLQQQPSYARCKADLTWEIFNTPKCKDSTPPSFIDCPSQHLFIAEKGSSSAIVTWTEPTGVDNVDNFTMVTQLSGPSPGSRMEGEGTVKYQAFDAAGNPSDICEIDIIVDVIRCPSPSWSENAGISCDLGTVYGSRCNYTCDNGFEVSEPSTVECLQNGTWSYGFQPPTCSRITCGQPDTPENGEFQCFDLSYEYESVCNLECKAGFTADHSVFAICQANGQWMLTSTEQCRDFIPPTLYNCISYQAFYTDRGQNTATGNWIIPQATDNIDSTGDITIEQLSGPVLGSQLPVGTTYVEYRAVDSEGNPSVHTCSISVVVEEMMCNDPKYSFDDSNLLYNCSSFIWGDNCTLSCPISASLSLVGPKTITCEGTYWYYQDSVQPYCEAQVCPRNLNSPENGAVTYTNDAQPVVFVTCDIDYDLEKAFQGQVFCLDNGTWTTNPIPECTRARRPGLNLLAVEYSYDGDCNDPVTIESIKDKVFEFLADFMGTAYELECLTDNTCGYDDLIVSCGPTSRKRREDDHHFIDKNIVKRQTSEVWVKIMLSKNGSVSSWDDLLSHENDLMLLSDLLHDRFLNNTPDAACCPVVIGSFHSAAYSTIHCEPGQVQEGFSCKSCAIGKFMEEINGSFKCTKCPIGTYMDHDSATECIACPPGTSTQYVGTQSSDLCLDLCPVGHSSLSGLVPCTPCSKGFYQDTMGQTSCKQCDTGHTTFSTGQDICAYYDVVFSGNQSVNIYNTTSDTNAITILSWVLKDCQTSLGIEFGNSELVIDIGSSIAIDGNSIMDYSPYCNKWTHVVLSVSNTGYTLFVNGETQKSDSQPVLTLIPTNSPVNKTFDTNNGEIRFSSFALYNYELPTTDISTYQSSCIAEYEGAILISDDLIHQHGGIDVDSSTCIATDSCAVLPCGSHLCTPTIDGYVCTCSEGYTGITCNIPPDICYQNDCQNGATCVRNEKNYTCACSPGYKGTFCQTLPVNGGWGSWSVWSSCSEKCDGGVRTRLRQCDSPAPSDYGTPCSGKNQEQEDCNLVSCATLFPCSLNPCGNHSCQETSTGFVCNCNHGYTGSVCEVVINNCEPNPCSNGGTCINMADDFQCECDEGYEGDICETVITEKTYWTAWSSCDVTCGGGTSTRTQVCVSDTTCATTEQKTCNDDPCPVDHCLSDPCQHGVCVSGVDDFKCICSAGFRGTACDEPIDACSNNPCQHGQCSPSGTTFTCTCESGYSGNHCSISEVQAHWSPWSEWTGCDVTCGSGLRQRSRLCNNPPPRSGGTMCEGDDAEIKTCTVECYESCDSNPCGVDHGCIVNGDSYVCQCKHGYTGSKCTIPPNPCDPNPCENGGLCLQDEDYPVCECINGYSGKTCGIHPDESSWGPWSEWSDCSVTCDTGEQSRTRECTVGSNGNECVGDDIEVMPCSIVACPKCPFLSRRYGMYKNCNSTGETTDCTLSCREGYFPPQNTSQSTSWSTTYRCGPFTGYEWTPPVEDIECSKGQKPRSFVAGLRTPIEPAPPCSKTESMKNIIEARIDDQVCQSRLGCDVEVSLANCGSRKKRAAESEIILTFVFNMTSYDGTNSSVDLWSVANDSLSPIINGNDSWSSITLDGITYEVDLSNFTDTGEVECDEGLFYQESFAYCAGCSRGSWFDVNSQTCEYCPMGSYQELSGKLSCDLCPNGYTTLITGSKDRNDCIYTSEEGAGSNHLGFILGGTLGGLVLICAIVGGTIYVKYFRKNTQVAASSTDLQGSDKRNMYGQNCNVNWKTSTQKHSLHPRPSSAASVSVVKLDI